MVNGIVRGLDGRPYGYEPAADTTVFVAEQPSTSSDARATPHTGFAMLRAFLHPVLGGELHALLRLPDGAMIQVLARHLRPMENVATRRILPPQARAARRVA